MPHPPPPTSSDDEAVPAPIKPKPTRRPRDDLSGNEVLSRRTRDPSQRQPSDKQGQNEKENLVVAQAKYAKLQKEVEKMKRQMSKQSKANGGAPAPPTDDELESEEKEDSDREAISFQSSIRPLNPLPAEPPRPTAVLRKVKKNAGPPKTSSRAFLAIPEPTNEGQTSPSPSDDILDRSTSPSGHDDLFDPLIDSPDPRRCAGRDDHGHNDASSSPARGRSTPAAASSAGSRKHPRQSSPSPPPPPKRKRKEPQFAEGYVYTAGTKPKASDYEPVVNALLIRAMAEYCMFIVTINAFPDVALQLVWARECFRNACRVASEHFTITDRMIKLITKRGSWIRSQIITACRTLFAPHYQFNRTSASSAVIEANRELSDKLSKGAVYHYKDVDASTGYAENSILGHIRKESLFKKKTSLGIIFASHFDPYPAPTLAIEFSALQHCNSEWSTGKFVMAEFTEKEVSKNYATHLKDIQRWADINKGVVDNIRRKWYKRASQGLVADASEGATHISQTWEEALRAELAGRTGETDSESEQA
ncbi:hypothetical protein B0H14DRAFT_210673 [Mycena olivaceomarginata]|nr:hypothetical protein B0H14DRAFT_210673 [Mycena olivaceomarginata]